MVRGHQRLLSTIPSTVAAPRKRPFPPNEAKRGPAFFDPDEWASRQPPPPTALQAFAHRIGLSDSLADPTVIQQICIHPSFVPLHRARYPREPIPPSNGALASLGNALLGLFATEHVNSTFPHLPTRVVKAVVSAYVGPLTCASVAQEIGASQLLRWNRPTLDPSHVTVLHTDALSSIPRALTALIYQQRSIASARKFAHSYFLSRTVDIRALLRFRDPKEALKQTAEKFGRERPVSRLLKETGRLSNSPIFVVGIYSGADKLGEGFGSSLRMAEYRAAEDSLHRLYLTRQPSEHFSLPTTTFASTEGSVFDGKDQSADYIPGIIGESEVNYGWSGKGGQAVGGWGQRLPDGVSSDKVEVETPRHNIQQE